jgi:1-aminocyclopropane-1-carboxylate deaminase/D-cysteine desulfhydrase-like pyridoxal-dependent ACC family enzyme
MTVESQLRLSPDELRERIARLPRIRGFLLGPTPLEEAPRLSEALGGKLIGAGWHLDVVSVGGSAEALLAEEVRLANRVAELLGLPPLMGEGDFSAYDEYVGSGYADTPPTTLEAIKLAARTDAIFLDPIYTGKALSGLIGEIRKGRLTSDDTVVFVHTGGLPIIFAFPELLAGL